MNSFSDLRFLSPALEVRENRAFAREMKFAIPAELGSEIRGWARKWLSPDPHAGGKLGDTYRTSSIYFDTRSFDVLRKTASFGRSKYRIRRYGESKDVYLERKLKTADLVSKRRSMIDVAELGQLENAEPRRDWVGFWFHRRIEARRLRPVCQISYLRMARIGACSSGAIRLTLDQDLRAIPVNRTAFHPARDGARLSEGCLILELKFRDAMPGLFQQLMESLGLEAKAVSKYRLAAAAPDCVDGWVAPSAPVPGMEPAETAA